MVGRLDMTKAPRIGLDEAKQHFDRGKGVLFVDVRNRPEYERAHIPGALGIPFRDLFSRIAELPKEDELILY